MKSGALYLLAIAASAVPTVAAAHPSVAVVMDSRGNVFYSDLSRVWMIAPDGTKSIAVPGVHTHELHLDPDGTLYGEHVWYEGEQTDKWGYRVWKRSPQGTITTMIPATTGFITGYSFVRDRTGTMYWAERRKSIDIRKRKSGGPITVHSRGPFRDVRWMISNPDGVLYLIDAGDLKKILPSGKVITIAPKIASRSITRFNVGERHAVMGLWLDRAGNVYAAVYGAGVVKRVTPAGVVTAVARSRLPWSPTGGMVAPDGSMWILETTLTNAVRVKRIGRDGTVKAF